MYIYYTENYIMMKSFEDTISYEQWLGVFVRKYSFYYHDYLYHEDKNGYARTSK